MCWLITTSACYCDRLDRSNERASSHSRPRNPHHDKDDFRLLTSNRTTGLHKTCVLLGSSSLSCTEAPDEGSEALARFYDLLLFSPALSQPYRHSLLTSLTLASTTILGMPRSSAVRRFERPEVSLRVSPATPRSSLRLLLDRRPFLDLLRKQQRLLWHGSRSATLRSSLLTPIPGPRPSSLPRSPRSLSSSCATRCPLRSTMPNRQSLRRFRTKLGEVFGAVSASFSSRHGAFSTAFKTGVENVVGERCWGPNGTLSDAQAARVYDRLAYDAHLISLIDWTSLTIQTTTVAHFVGIIVRPG